MTIAYNLGIPAAPNNPTLDQPNMLTNNNNIATYMAIDHVPFNTSGSGQHEQVTFNSNNVPSGIVSPPVLFTNTVSGLPQLFFYSGAAASGANQYVASATGSTFLLGGIIIKWGSAAITDASQSFTSLGQTAFPNACFAMIVNSTDSAYENSLAVTAKSATAFTVTRSNGSGNTGYYYFAIGN